MKILIVAPMTEASSGNAATARRLARYFPSSVIFNCDAATSAQLAAALDDSFDAVICLHALRAGRLLDGVRQPRRRLILVLGGTDVNVYMSALSNTSETDVLQRAVSAAAAIVAFSGALADGVRAFAATRQLCVAPITHIIPQAVEGAETLLRREASPHEPSMHAVLSLPAATPVILLVAGFRPVKDPLFVVEAFVQWRAAQGERDNLPVLLLVGPALDPATADAIRLAASVSATAPFGGTDGVFVHPSVSREVILSWVRQATVALNSSLSEGQSNFLLEAMFAWTPVVARNCVGNAALVCHGETGVLFDTPAEAVAACAYLCRRGVGSVLAAHLTSRAHAYVTMHHTEEGEQRAWVQLLASCQESGGTGEAHSKQYAPWARCALSPQQLQDASTVAQGLAHLRDVGFVVVPPSAGASSETAAVDWPHDANVRWPSAPFVYNFGSSADPDRPAPSAQTADDQRALLVQPNIGSPPQRLGWGCYAEDRNIYVSDHFAAGPAGSARTWHLGVDLEAPPSTPVLAPLAGTVHSVGIDESPLGYGPTIILQHRLTVSRRCVCGTLPWALGPCTGPTLAEPVTQVCQFYTLYGHLSRASVFHADGRRPLREPGTLVAAGDVLGTLGSPLLGENGGWFPHVHFQICTESNLGGWHGDYPGVCRPGDWPAYAALTLDPNIILRCPWVAPRGDDVLRRPCTGIEFVVVS